MLFLAAVVTGLLVGGIVGGVRLLGRGGSDIADGAATVSASATAEPGSLLAAAEAFAADWSAGQYSGLFARITPASQANFPEATFLSEYRGFATEMTARRVVASVTSIQGNRARLAVHLETTYFATFDYATSLSFERSGGVWLVAWDRTAIHPDLTGERFFRSTIERPRRGAILDRNGQPFAITRDTRFLGLNRAVIQDRDALKAALVEFGFTAGQVDAAYASTVGQNQRVAVGPVPDERAEAAASLPGRFNGVLIFFESRRVHPAGVAAAHAVGYTRELTAEELAARAGTGFRPGDRVGAAGLEATLDERLAGKIGAELRLVEGDGSTAKTLQSRPFLGGEDITTSLDIDLQRIAQARMGARAGAAVLLDPRTNAVLALVSNPSFDPDAFERNDAAALDAISRAPNSPQVNRATAGLYSGGSTFKLVTAAAGLAYGGYTPSDRIFCGAVWTGIDPPRRNWEGTQGPLTIAEGLMRSCNPVFYEIALKLYNTADGALAKMARQFGYGAASGVKFLPEEDGLVPDAAWKRAKRGEAWFPGDEVNLGIGQGDLLITPLQLANAYSTLVAADLRNPVILAGQVAESRGKLPLTAEQLATLRRGLELVTSTTGTARAAFADSGYTNFAGKSGTAEDAGAQQHVLFTAYAPATAPRAVASVVLDEGQSGSIEAGPIARDLVLAALKN